MTANDAKRLVLRKYSNRKVDGVFSYNGGYLVLAPRTDIDPMNDFSDPYFVVDSKGKCSAFTPMMDLHGFDKAVNSRRLDT